MFLNTKVCDVEAVPGGHGGFRIFVCDGTDSSKGAVRQIRCRLVLIATGGKSYASYGSTGDGQMMARRAGHTVSPMIPALTAIEVREDLRELRGVRVKSAVSLVRIGRFGLQRRRADTVQRGLCVRYMYNEYVFSSSRFEDRGREGRSGRLQDYG